MKRIIKTPNAPAAIGPYSQAVEINGTLYISGQIAIDPATGRRQRDAERADPRAGHGCGGRN